MGGGMQKVMRLAVEAELEIQSDALFHDLQIP